MAERMNKLVIDNARLIFKNFSGKGDAYNREGDRNFAVIIDDPNAAEDLARAGWNVRPLISKDPDEDPTHYIKVKVSFKVRAPKVRLLSNHKQVFLNENTISSLDFARSRSVALSSARICGRSTASVESRHTLIRCTQRLRTIHLPTSMRIMQIRRMTDLTTARSD